MKKLLKAIVWILAALVVIFIGGGYLLPNEVTLATASGDQRAAGKGFCTWSADTSVSMNGRHGRSLIPRPSTHLKALNQAWAQK